MAVLVMLVVLKIGTEEGGEEEDGNLKVLEGKIGDC